MTLGDFSPRLKVSTVVKSDLKFETKLEEDEAPLKVKDLRESIKAVSFERKGVNRGYMVPVFSFLLVVIPH